jgi:DNA-binding MarR family transcriptional regulator
MNRATDKSADLVPLIIADIYQLAGDLRGRGEEIAQGIGQSQARWQVLSAASAEPKTVPQIARRLGVSRQAVQRLANELVEEQMARFAPNPDHQGSPHLVLTKDGKAALARLTKAGTAFHERVAATASAAELQAIHQGLRRLIGALERVRTDTKRRSTTE